MAWVRSEYAGELAVLAVWLTAFLPWSVSHVTVQFAGQSVTVVNIRFLLFQFHYLFGVSLGEQGLDNLVQFVHEIPGWVPPDQQLEATIWLAGAALFVALLALSIALYLREDAVTERLPVDVVRLVGAAFALLGAVFSVATVLFFPHQLTVPVGTLFMWVFAVTLLRVERT